MINKVIRWLVWFGAFGWAVLTILRLVTNTFSPIFSVNPPYVDFHAFWYAGHFLLQGMDPYQGPLQNLELTLPIQYLDGMVISTQPVAQMPVGNLPSLTAPLLLFMSLFSFFSWPVAKVLWMVSLLGLAVVIPVLVLRLLPEKGKTLSKYHQSLVIFIFLGLSATRSALGSAHVSLLVLALLVAAIHLSPRKWILAGLCFGFALSKFPLAWPLLLFFLLFKEYKVIVVAAVVQIIGILGLSLLTGISPVVFVQDYLLLLKLLSPQIGIQLTNLLPLGSHFAGYLNVIFSILVWLPLLYWIVQHRALIYTQKYPALKVHLMGILMSWAVLVTYHRTYDAIIYIFFISLYFYGTVNKIWRLSNLQYLFLLCVFSLCTLVMMLPGNITFFFFPTWINQLWMSSVDKSITVALVLMTFTFLWLLFKVQDESGKNVQTAQENI